MAMRVPGLMSSSKRSRFIKTSSLANDSLMVTVHVLSRRAAFAGGGPRTVELLEIVSGEADDSAGSLSKLVLLNWRRCDVHGGALRGAGEPLRDMAAMRRGVPMSISPFSSFRLSLFFFVPWAYMLGERLTGIGTALNTDMQGIRRCNTKKKKNQQKKNDKKKKQQKHTSTTKEAEPDRPTGLTSHRELS